MRKDWKYILYIVIALAVFVVLKVTSPKQYDWRITYSPDDKNPYGGYAVGQLIEPLFNRKIQRSYETIYELKDSLNREGSIFILTTRLVCGNADTKALLKFVHDGGSALIAAQYFWGELSDTLGFRASDYFFTQDGFDRTDSAYIQFTAPAFDTTARFTFRRDNVHNYFRTFDSATTTVIARNDLGQPVALRIRFGKGNIILNCTPLAFTNIYALAGRNHEFVSGLLSYLPPGSLQWTEYYHFGRREAGTPLRFILTSEPLRWAYYIAIVSLLLFMVFEMKRRQRIIPVITPPSNTTLEFVATIGNLYYQNNDHKNIAEKRILFLLEHIRIQYGLSTNHPSGEFVSTLAKKSGKDENEIRKLFQMIAQIRSAATISSDELVKFNAQIELCNL